MTTTRDEALKARREAVWEAWGDVMGPCRNASIPDQMLAMFDAAMAHPIPEAKPQETAAAVNDAAKPAERPGYGRPREKSDAGLHAGTLRDAERYRWCRENITCFYLNATNIDLNAGTPEQFDSMVDAEIAKEKDDAK